MQLSAKYLQEVFKLVVNLGFENRNDEVIFFKLIKPQILSTALFYEEVIIIETAKHENTKENNKRFLNKRHQHIVKFLHKNRRFYSYYNSKFEVFDEQFFLRYKSPFFKKRRNADSMIDIYFSTKFDMLMAKVMAYEKLLAYLNAEIKKLDLPDSSENEPEQYKSVFTWTETKVAFAELIYALYDTKAIDNGKADIKELAKKLGEFFNILPGDIYHTFAETKYRKKSTTNFIDKLREALSKRAFNS